MFGYNVHLLFGPVLRGVHNHGALILDVGLVIALCGKEFICGFQVQFCSGFACPQEREPVLTLLRIRGD